MIQLTIDQNIILNLMTGDVLGQLAEEAVGDDSMRQLEVHVGESVREVSATMTPLVTGSLASAHTVFVTGTETFVAIDPSAQNPRSVDTPATYGPKVHEMGGISRSGHQRDFYTQTVQVHGPVLLEEAGVFYFTKLEAVL